MSPQCTFEDQCDRQTTPYIHPVHHVHRPRQPEPTVRHCIVHNPDKERRYRQKDTGDVRPIRMVEEGIFEICPVEDCTASHTDDVDEKDNEVDHEEDGTDLALAVERKLDAAYEDGDGSCTHVDCEAADTVFSFQSALDPSFQAITGVGSDGKGRGDVWLTSKSRIHFWLSIPSACSSDH